MQVKRKSAATGRIQVRDIEDITPTMLAEYDSGDLGPVQEAFPFMAEEDREFLSSGMTPAEAEAFGIDGLESYGREEGHEEEAYAALVGGL